MRAWRIYDHHAAFAAQPDFDPLRGDGGLHYDGRWHRKGHPVLYAAASPSLALLETLVHVDPVRFREQTLLELEFDDDVERITHARLVQLLRDATEGRVEAGTRDFGHVWLSERRTLALEAPSIIMPFENNVILNPRHPRAGSIRVVRSEVVTLDARRLRKNS